MTIRTRKNYLQSLSGLRPNIYKFGKLIEDVTTHPATRRTVESHARGFDAAHDRATTGIFTTKSFLTGKRILRFNSLMTTQVDVIANARLKRNMFRITGTCTGGLCVGWNAQNALWNVTAEVDQERGTSYHAHLEKWIKRAEKKGLVVASALTDAKGDRSLKPSKQPNRNSHVFIKKIRKDGIVVSGVKAMICGVAASEEIFILPGSVYGEEERDFAVSFAVPRDAPGLTIVEARRPSDGREFEKGFDIPETGITQAYLIFQDVFIPQDRVFLCGEYQYTGNIIKYFTANYRACIGAMALGTRHPAGVWVSNSLLAHINKVHVATLPYITKRICQEICGGAVETGCFPAYDDLTSPDYGEVLQETLRGGSGSAESRARIIRLAEWLTLGAGVPGCMHGGGSPNGARLVVKNETPLADYAGYASHIAGLSEELTENKKQPGSLRTDGKETK